MKYQAVTSLFGVLGIIYCCGSLLFLHRLLLFLLGHRQLLYQLSSRGGFLTFLLLGLSLLLGDLVYKILEFLAI
jgi:hypothetical protein